LRGEEYFSSFSKGKFLVYHNAWGARSFGCKRLIRGRAMGCTYFQNSLTSSKVLTSIRINQIFHPLNTHWVSWETKIKWHEAFHRPQVQAFQFFEMPREILGANTHTSNYTLKKKQSQRLLHLKLEPTIYIIG
jgi:hypothetical protein